MLFCMLLLFLKNAGEKTYFIRCCQTGYKKKQKNFTYFGANAIVLSKF